ncbi:hypothetical protein ACSBR2_011922 [Camellia fascicularis]
MIDFGGNQLQGKMPRSLAGCTELEILDCSNNLIEDTFPFYLKGQLLNLSNNDLSGGTPSCFRNLTNLESLDLSQNRFSGKIPQQLALPIFLAILNVSNNHLTGPIPHGKQFNTFENNSYRGNFGLCRDPLSRKCGKSEAPPPPPPLNSEQDNDSTFPSRVDWIVICMGYVSGIVVGMVIGHSITTRDYCKTVEERQFLCMLEFHGLGAVISFLIVSSLIELQVLILQSDKLYSAIGSPETKLVLPNLRSIDLSHNGFIGALPTSYFQNWNIVKFVAVDRMAYMYATRKFPAHSHILVEESYFHTMNITNKGVNTEYEKILNIFTAIDFSSNKFKGEIPESIGSSRDSSCPTFSTMTLAVKSHHS